MSVEDDKKAAEAERIRKMHEEAAKQYKEAQEAGKLLPYEQGFIGKQ